MWNYTHILVHILFSGTIIGRKSIQLILKNMEELHQQPEPEKVESKPFEPAGGGTGKNTGMAVVAYILFFIPLLTEAKHDSFVMYHVKQGFVLFIAAVIANILLVLMPFLMLVGWALQIGVLILLVIGIMNALAGKEEPLPLIGQFADKAPF